MNALCAFAKWQQSQCAPQLPLSFCHDCNCHQVLHTHWRNGERERRWEERGRENKQCTIETTGAAFNRLEKVRMKWLVDMDLDGMASGSACTSCWRQSWTHIWPKLAQFHLWSREAFVLHVEVNGPVCDYTLRTATVESWQEMRGE